MNLEELIDKEIELHKKQNTACGDAVAEELLFIKMEMDINHN
jgi:hypothetical protein